MASPLPGPMSFQVTCWLRWLWWTCVKISVNCCENEMVTIASFGCSLSNTSFWDMRNSTTQQSAPLKMHSFFAAAWSLPDCVSEMVLLDETPSILQVLWNSQDWHCHMAYVAPLRAKGWNKARLSYIYIVCIIEFYIFLYYSLQSIITFIITYVYILRKFQFWYKTQLRTLSATWEQVSCWNRSFCWSEFRDEILICRCCAAAVSFFCSRDTERSFERSLDSCGPSRVEYVKCWRSQTSRTPTQVKSM